MDKQVITRKDEVKFTTSDVTKIAGMWLTAPALKYWKEDFIDESTGEIVSVNRSELVMERGKYIDADTQAKLNFFISCGDIKEVEVSNQHRRAHVNDRYALYPFKVTANIQGKKHNFILQANNANKAIEVATDYIELYYAGGFDIVGVKWLENVVIMNEPLRPASEVLSEPTEGEDAEETTAQQARDEDTKYYKVEANLTVKSEDEEEPEEQPYVFIVKTKDVDTAKVVLSAWVEAKVAERSQRDGDERKVVELSILAASPFSCNAIIDKEFCLAYKEEQDMEELRMGIIK